MATPHLKIDFPLLLLRLSKANIKKSVKSKDRFLAILGKDRLTAANYILAARNGQIYLWFSLTGRQKRVDEGGII